MQVKYLVAYLKGMYLMHNAIIIKKLVKILTIPQIIGKLAKLI